MHNVFISIYVTLGLFRLSLDNKDREREKDRRHVGDNKEEREVRVNCVYTIYGNRFYISAKTSGASFVNNSLRICAHVYFYAIAYHTSYLECIYMYIHCYIITSQDLGTRFYSN